MLALGCVIACACGGSRPPSAPGPWVSSAPYGSPLQAHAPAESGLATWYGAALAGHRTASGERFDPAQFTAAHRTLPLGTWVDVTNVRNGHTVRVRINDRGPYGSSDRIIDLSHAAAAQIDMVRAGVARVEVRIVAWPPPRR